MHRLEILRPVRKIYVCTSHARPPNESKLNSNITQRSLTPQNVCQTYAKRIQIQLKRSPTFPHVPPRPKTYAKRIQIQLKRSPTFHHVSKRIPNVPSRFKTYTKRSITFQNVCQTYPNSIETYVKRSITFQNVYQTFHHVSKRIPNVSQRSPTDINIYYE